MNIGSSDVDEDASIVPSDFQTEDASQSTVALGHDSSVQMHEFKEANKEHWQKVLDTILPPGWLDRWMSTTFMVDARDFADVWRKVTSR